MAMDDAALQAMLENAPADPDTLADDLDFGDVTPEVKPVAVEKPVAKAEEVSPAEGEEPAEESADSAEEDGEKAEKPERPVRGMIPRHRYNFAQEKRRAAEERAQALEAEVAELRARTEQASRPSREQLIAAVDQRINALDLEIEAARADNDAQRAAALRAEQRNLERQLARAEMPAPTDPTAATKLAVEHFNTQETIKALEMEYPVLEEGGKEFDAELSEEVMDTFELFLARMPRAQALQRAAAYVLGAHGIQPRSQQTQVRTGREAALKKNLAAAAAQPPELNMAGLDSNRAGATRKLDVMAMSVEDFEKIGDREMDELLGNFDV